MMILQLNSNRQEVARFDSLSEAEHQTGIKERTIKRCLSGELKTGGGFVWTTNTTQQPNMTQSSSETVVLDMDTYKSLIRTYSQNKVKDIKERPLGRKSNQQGLHVVVGCLHLPAHNKELWSSFLNLMKDLKPELKGIHLIGDILDCYSLSSHNLGNISSTTLDQEYRDANIALDELDAVLSKDIEKNYIWGNHEERYSRLLAKVDIAKFGKALLSPTDACRFIERGYDVQEDYKNGYVTLGDHLDLIHGEYVTTNSPKKHLDVYKKSVMFAHTHLIGQHYDCDMAAFNIGWMGDIEHPFFSYASRVSKTKWHNGFALVNIDEDGFFHVTQIHWYNNRFYYNGKEY